MKCVDANNQELRLGEAVECPEGRGTVRSFWPHPEHVGEVHIRVAKGSLLDPEWSRWCAPEEVTKVQEVADA